MIAKNKYIFWESIITIASILLIAGLLRNALSVNFIYISVGLIGSLSFSWLVKGKFDNALKYAIAVGIFVILAWLIHSVLNSSLIYKDVVLLVVLRLFILEILLGLASFSPEILNCIQMLSVPLFMSHAVWIRQYDPASGLLILGCLFCWFLVLKIKFYHFFESINIPKLKKDHSIKLSIVFLAASALISWLFFSNILFNRTWGVGILTTEDKTGSDQLSEDTAEGKEFFVSQERFVEKIGNLIPKLESQQERGEALIMLSVIINDSSYVLELEKARSGLIDKFKTPGPGIDPEDAEGATITIEQYMAEKILNSLKNKKNSINSNLKNHPYGLGRRISIMNSVKNIQESNSLKDISKNRADLEIAVDKSNVSGSSKKELKGLARSMQEWKVLQSFHKLLDSLSKMVKSPENDPLMRAIQGLLEDIKSAQDPSAMKEINAGIKELENSPQTSDSSKTLGAVKELYDLKQEMVSSKENKDGIDKLEQSKLPQDIIERVKESLEEIQAARELKTTQEEITKIKDALNNNLDKLPKDTKDYLKDRLEFLLDQKNNQFKEALKENNITESNKESLFQLGQNLEKIESTTNENKVERKVNDMLDKLDKAFSQGEITEKARDKLKNYLKEIQGLLEDRLGLEEINDAMKGINKSGVENVIESIPSLTNFQRDALNNLNEELGKADNLTQLEIIMEGVEKEIVSLERVISKEDSDRLKNEFKKVAEARREIIIARATHQLRKSLEELRESNPEDAQEIDGYLKKLDNAKTNIQLQEVIDSIGEYSSKKQEVDKKEVLDKKDESSLFKDIARQINDSLDKFKDTLKENRVDQINKELLQQLENELEKARSAETQDKLKDSLDKILEKTDQAFIQGQINEETKDKLNESLERTQSLAAAKLSLESADVKQKLKSSINADKEKGLSKAAEESKESVSNDPKGKKLPTPDKLANKDTLNIFILPESLILVNGSVTSIKTIAVYSNRLIKEITPEVSWLVVNPKVASINDNGTVYAISVGFTEIYAQYKGLKSKGVMVRVVNKISDDTYSELKKVLKK